MKPIVKIVLCTVLIGTAQVASSGFQIQSIQRHGTIRLWNAKTGEARNVTFDDGDVTALAFSPSGTLLATGSGNRSIDLWDFHTGKKIAALTGHKEAVQTLAFSSDGRTLASGSWDGTIRLWSPETGKQLGWFVASSGEVLSVAFSANGKYLVSGGGEAEIRLWDVGRKRLVRTFRGRAKTVNSVAFNVDGTVLAAAAADNTITLWEVQSGQLLRTLEGHSDAVEAVAFNPANKILASASRDKSIKLWDTGTGAEVMTLRGHLSSVDCLAFSTGGDTLATGSYDKTIKLWDMTSGRELLTLEGHRERVTALAFSPRGEFLASASALKRIADPTLHILALGISHYYQPSGATFDGAAKDAKDFAAALEKAGRTQFGRVVVRVLTDYSASGMAISSAVARTIEESKPQDVFVLFFAGIASTEFNHADGQQYGLFAADSERLPEVLLKSWLTQIEARQQFVILETKDTAKGYELFIKQFASDNKALRALTKRNLVILANASAASAESSRKNRPLMHRLLQGLAGEATLEGGKLTAKSLADYAKDNTYEAKPKRKTDEIATFSIGEDFQLANFKGDDKATTSLTEGRDKPRHHAHVELRQAERVGLPADDVVRERLQMPNTTKPLQGPPNLSRKGKDYALLFGTNEYDKWKPLSNAVRDAEYLATELRDYYGFETEVIKNATLDEVFKVLVKYKDRQYTDDDQLFVFFAGHGFYDMLTKQGCLAFKDSDSHETNTKCKTSLCYPELRNILDDLNCRHIFLVIDACSSGTFDEMLARGVYRGAPEIDPRRIERIMQFKTRRYLASAGDSPVYDGDRGGHSPFTRALLEALRKYGGLEGFLSSTHILLSVQGLTPTPTDGKWGHDEPGSEFFFVVKQPRSPNR